jgi:hypothetical protein
MSPVRISIASDGAAGQFSFDDLADEGAKGSSMNPVGMMGILLRDSGR